MVARGSPLVRRRRLAMELRRLREATGHTIEEVADYLDCSAAKVSRIETAQVSARLPDVRGMLDLYRVTGPSRDELLGLVRQARQAAWWHEYADVLTEGQEIFYGLEDEAASIWTYETHLVPGLLQTTDYARACLTAPGGVPLRTAERRLALRMARQSVLERADPPRLCSILDEAVLRRTIGGPEVMRAQVLRLVRAASTPHVTVQVVPYLAGAYTALTVPFVLFEFARPGDPKVVFTEQLTRHCYIDRPEEVGLYQDAYEQARERALGPAESVALMTDLARTPP